MIQQNRFCKTSAEKSYEKCVHILSEFLTFYCYDPLYLKCQDSNNHLSICPLLQHLQNKMNVIAIFVSAHYISICRTSCNNNFSFCQLFQHLQNIKNVTTVFPFAITLAPVKHNRCNNCLSICPLFQNLQNIMSVTTIFQFAHYYGTCRIC